MSPIYIDAVLYFLNQSNAKKVCLFGAKIRFRKISRVGASHKKYESYVLMAQLLKLGGLRLIRSTMASQFILQLNTQGGMLQKFSPDVKDRQFIPSSIVQICSGKYSGGLLVPIDVI